MSKALRPVRGGSKTQAPIDREPRLLGQPRRVWALMACGLVLTGGIALFLLEEDQSTPSLPRVTNLDTLAPEVRDLVQEATTALAVDRRAADRWGRLGMALEANGLLTAAFDAYQGATLVRPQEARWWYRLAIVHARLGDAAAAIASVRRSIDLSPDYAPAHWRLGLWLLDLDDTDGAARAFARASEIDPADPAGVIGLGRVYLQRREDVRAVELLERALVRTPGDRYAMQLLGTAYSRLGRTDEAASALAIGVSGEPSWADPWTDDMTSYRRGFAVRLKDATRHFLDGRTGPAITLLEALHRERPDDLALLSHLGEVYVAALRSQDGIRALEQVVARDSERYGAYVALASGYLQQQDLARAADAIDRAIALNPVFGRAYETKGLILWRRGDEAGARTMFERAVHFDPRAVRAMVWKGMIELNLSNAAAALASFTQATRLDPVRVDAWVGIANAAMAMRRVDQAEAALARAAKLSPDSPEVRQAIARLRSERR
jgi:tetratricopeptide (TPR) repeat protein